MDHVPWTTEHFWLSCSISYCFAALEKTAQNGENNDVFPHGQPIIKQKVQKIRVLRNYAQCSNAASGPLKIFKATKTG